MLRLLEGLCGQMEHLLVVGAHADDIEIGCGATVLTLLRACAPLRVTWVVLSAPGERANEAWASASACLDDAGDSDVAVDDFTDRFFPTQQAALKERFDGLGQELIGDDAPQLILTHRRDDAHQDHQLVSDLTWQTFRDHLVLEYEIPKWDGDLGRPNTYVPVDAEAVERKLSLLHEHFPSQRLKHWFDDETFRGLLRLRGLECRAPSGHAEAFTARKLVL